MTDPAVTPTPAEFAELLQLVRGIAEDMHGLRGDFAHADSRRPAQPERFAALLPIVAEFAGQRAFNTAELIRHALLPEAAALRAGIMDAVGVEHQARKLGKWLRRVDGQIIGCLQLHRIGRDAQGAIWRVETVDSDTRTQ